MMEVSFEDGRKGHKLNTDCYSQLKKMENRLSIQSLYKEPIFANT